MRRFLNGNIPSNTSRTRQRSGVGVRQRRNKIIDPPQWNDDTIPLLFINRCTSQESLQVNLTVDSNDTDSGVIHGSTSVPLVSPKIYDFCDNTVSVPDNINDWLLQHKRDKNECKLCDDVGDDYYGYDCSLVGLQYLVDEGGDDYDEKSKLVGEAHLFVASPMPRTVSLGNDTSTTIFKVADDDVTTVSTSAITDSSKLSICSTDV